MGKFKFTDLLNSMSDAEKNTSKEYALNNSNLLKKYGVEFSGQIVDVFNGADYLKIQDPTKIENWNPELGDSKTLQQLRILRIEPENLNLSDGAKYVDIVMNFSKTNNIKFGDIGEQRLDVEGKEASWKYAPEFEKWLEEELIDKSGLKDVVDAKEIIATLKPKKIEELLMRACKDRGLAVKGKEAVNKVNKNRAFGEKSVETEMEEKEVEEDTPDKIADRAGMSLSALEKFCEENNVPINAVKGAARTENTRMLEERTGKELGAEGATVIALRVNDEGLNSHLALIADDGKTLSYRDIKEKGVEEDLLDRVVPSQSGSNTVENINETLQDPSFESRSDEECKKILRETREKIIAVAENDELDPVTKAKQIEELAVNAYVQVYMNSDQTTNQEIVDFALDRANDAVARTDRVIVQEGVKDALGIDKENDEPEAFEVPGKRTH